MLAGNYDVLDIYYELNTLVDGSFFYEGEYLLVGEVIVNQGNSSIFKDLVLYSNRSGSESGSISR